MITEGSLATAQIAQLFGSELLKVQSSAQTDSGMQPEIVRLNPKQFLVGEAQFTNERKQEEQRLMKMLQAEAEASCPLPLDQQQYSQPLAVPPQQQIPTPPPTQLAPPPPPVQTQQSISSGDVWERISQSLERIANSLERVDISVKKKRIRRIAK